MLIKAPIKTNDIVSFRLVSGETLLAKYVDMTASKLIVTRPVVANPIQQNGSYGVYYTPFCPTVDEDEKHEIPVTAIMMLPTNPRQELVDAYVKMTSSIELPPSGLEIPR